jgi:hypothetical protein
MKFERRLEALPGELCGEAFSAQMARFLPLDTATARRWGELSAARRSAARKRGGAGSFLLMFALDILRQNRGRNAHSIVVVS